MNDPSTNPVDIDMDKSKNTEDTPDGATAPYGPAQLGEIRSPAEESPTVGGDKMNPVAASGEPEPVSCPACRGAVHSEAEVCPHCHALLRGSKRCPQCAETVRQAARICRFCQYDFVSDPLRPLSAAEAAEAERPLRQVSADPLGGMICEWIPTNLFRPPVITLNRREITVLRWSWMGLRKYEQKVGLNRVASVRTHHGIFWSSLIVETLGGSIADLIVDGLDKAEAEDMARVIEQFTLHQTEIYK